MTFNLEVIDNPCTANLVVPADNDLDYFVTAVNATDQVIPLPNISNGDCEFEIELTSITNLTAEEETAMFVSTTQPTFASVSGAIDTRIVDITADGFITVNTELISTRRIIAVELTVSSKKNIHDTATAVTNFQIWTSFCPSDFSSAVSGNHALVHYLRNSTEALLTLTAQDTQSCARSHFEAKYDGQVVPADSIIPELWRFTVDEVQGELSEGTLIALWTEDFSNVGQYRLEVYEQHYDDPTSFFMQNVTVEILDPCVLYNISAPSLPMDIIYKEDTGQIKVSWYPFATSPDDPANNVYCPPTGVSFSAATVDGTTGELYQIRAADSRRSLSADDQDDATFTVDLVNREAIVNLETIERTTNFTFEVVEAIYAVDVTTRISQISQQAS